MNSSFPDAAVEARLRAREAVFATHLAAIETFAPALEAIGPDCPPAPRWNQDWFPRLDAAAAYAMVRRHAPARIVEIGSGHSTRFMARAIVDGRLTTRMTSIDPKPRAVLDGLDLEAHRVTLEDAGLAPFEVLRGGDILFIDSSHKRSPGSDVDLLLGRVLPALAPGVRIHVHDIFLPADYPEDWVWRQYNEQESVAELLVGGDYEVEFACAWVVSTKPEWLSRGVLGRLPLVDGARESSLWMVKRR